MAGAIAHWCDLSERTEAERTKNTRVQLRRPCGSFAIETAV